MTARKMMILAQSPRAAASRLVRAPTAGQWLAVALLGLFGVAAFGLAPGRTLEATPTQVIRIDLPRPAVPVIDTDAGAAEGGRSESPA